MMIESAHTVIIMVMQVDSFILGLNGYIITKNRSTAIAVSVSVDT